MSSSTGRPPTCTVKISGGLGNQMFQYAAGRALALRSGARLALDVSFFRSRRHRNLELQQLAVRADAVISHGALGNLFRKYVRRDIKNRDGNGGRYREPHYHYDAAFGALEPPVTLDGYFQSDRYFADHASTIREELRCPEPTESATRQIAQQMTDSGATSLHVRRGDYLTNPNACQTFCTCTMDYYRDAMERIPGNDPVYVFSDDLAWAKENLPKVKPLVFPDSDVTRSGLDDLWLMTHARNHIIANSTFSWWGAWLADSTDGLTIAPIEWFIDKQTDDSDLIPEGWERL